jgi:hypothetical protein
MSVREGNAREVGRVGREGGEERERVGGKERWAGSGPAEGGRDFLLFFYFYFFFSFFFCTNIYLCFLGAKKNSM